MRNAVIVIFILGVLAAALGQAQMKRVRTERGVVELELSADNVNVRALISNLESRLQQLAVIAERNDECAQLMQPIILELLALIILFPSEIYVEPVIVEIIEPIDGALFAQFLGSLKEKTFSNDKLKFLQQVGSAHYFTCIQLAEILDCFSFSDDKLKAVRFLKPRIIDAENAFIIKDHFTFDSDKEKFMKIMYE